MADTYTGIHQCQVGYENVREARQNLKDALEATGFSPEHSLTGLRFQLFNHGVGCYFLGETTFGDVITYVRQRYPRWYESNGDIRKHAHHYFKGGGKQLLLLVIDERCAFDASSLRLITEAFAKAMGAHAMPRKGEVTISPNDDDNIFIGTVGRRSLLHLKKELLM